MIQLRLIPLDGRANQYMQGELAYGNPLAQAILTNINLSLGNVHAVVPDLAGHNFYEFKRSVFPTLSTSVRDKKGSVVRKMDSDTWMLEWLARELVAEDLVVSESFLVRSTQPGFAKFVSSIRARTVQMNSYVYCVADQAAAQPALVDVLSEIHRQPMGCGVVAKVAVPSDWRTSTTVSVTSLNELVDGVRHVVLGAYDGESFLIWTPAS